MCSDAYQMDIWGMAHSREIASFYLHVTGVVLLNLKWLQQHVTTWKTAVGLLWWFPIAVYIAAHEDFSTTSPTLILQGMKHGLVHI